MGNQQNAGTDEQDVLSTVSVQNMQQLLAHPPGETVDKADGNGAGKAEEEAQNVERGGHNMVGRHGIDSQGQAQGQICTQNAEQLVHTGKMPNAVIQPEQGENHDAGQTPHGGEGDKPLDVLGRDLTKVEIKTQPQSQKERTEDTDDVHYNQEDDPLNQLGFIGFLTVIRHSEAFLEIKNK